MQTCIGLALLAARKNNTLSDFKHLALALAIPGNEPWDLPTVPMFVMLQSDMNSCIVFESNDCALMSEIVQIILDADEATSEERLKLNSLAKRYRERASLMAASHIASTTGNQIEKPWWKFW